MKLVHLFSTIKMMHAPINLRSELLSYREIHPVNPVVSCNDLFILRRFSKAHLDCNLFPVTSKVISRPSVNFQRRDMSLSSVDSVRRPASGVRRQASGGTCRVAVNGNILSVNDCRCNNSMRCSSVRPPEGDTDPVSRNKWVCGFSFFNRDN